MSGLRRSTGFVDREPSGLLHTEPAWQNRCYLRMKEVNTSVTNVDARIYSLREQ